MLFRSTVDGSGYLRRKDATRKSNLNIRHATLIINSQPPLRANLWYV